MSFHVFGRGLRTRPRGQECRREPSEVTGQSNDVEVWFWRQLGPLGMAVSSPWPHHGLARRKTRDARPPTLLISSHHPDACEWLPEPLKLGETSSRQSPPLDKLRPLTRSSSR